MKYCKLLLALLLITSFISCKKAPTNPLIGKWSEQSPCVAGAGSCFSFELKNDNKYYDTPPAPDTGSYSISNNTITFNGRVLGHGTFEYLMPDNNHLVIKKYYTGFYVDTPLYHKDLNLTKVN